MKKRKRTDFGNALALWRRESGLTQEELGQKSGLTGAHICHFERGRRIPTLHNFKAIVANLHTTADNLLHYL
jgi:transcriptional regulator with XRE-family HTH domain